MERLRHASAALSVTLLIAAGAARSTAAAPGAPADPADPAEPVSAEHLSDLRTAGDWWRGAGPFPSAVARRLSDWVEHYPRDGQALFYLGLLRSRNAKDLP